ncbi:protein-disulfide reductase DsbD [Actimicrobium antarcticum]
MLVNLYRRLGHFLWCSLILICSYTPPVAFAADEYLEPEKAFQFSAEILSPGVIAVSYKIADGYYMYRDHFRFKAGQATLKNAEFPPGKVKFDETFQKNVETYRTSVTILVPFSAAGGFSFTATGQGCADAGLCYAPMDSVARLGAGSGGLFSGLSSGASSSTGPNGPPSVTPSVATSSSTESGRIESALKSGRLILILPLFFLLGLGLSFTPCVLPMVPILSSIIIGEGVRVSRGRGFLLSATYAFGMAVVYTALGVAAGLIGEGLSATLQNPWVLSGFAFLMVGLSLSMFGVYALEVPTVFQQHLISASGNQRSGKLVGVFIMGALSALIVGPCVAAPLAGALVYISQTRDVLIGGGALFSMAVGMSVPLLLLGLSAGTLLPRAGAWMESVKKFFGVLMLAVALWMVSPVLTPVVQMLAWALIGIGYGMYLLTQKRSGWMSKCVGMVFAAFGLMQLVGVASGGRDVLAPLAHLSSTPHVKVTFLKVKSLAELNTALEKAGSKTVMLDFYADWCVSCKEMEKLTFADPAIQPRLEQMVLLQADVTDNNVDDKALLKRFGLFGPPGIIFFRNREELSGTRVIGYQNAERFSVSLPRAE